MALYKNNRNIAQISLYDGGSTPAALPGVINTSYGANYGTGNTPVIPTTPTPAPVTFTLASLKPGSNDNNVDLSYGSNATTGTGEGTVTPTVATPPTETETPPAVTPPADTSGSEDGGTNTPTDTTIDSYYNYLKTETPEHLEGIYNDTIAAIDQANAKTIAEINAAKERGIVDANTSYQHNLSTYGAKNEALRGMGLAGSGYSEYLDSQAYATQRAEVQGVKAGALAAENNANATADAQKLEAKTALDENLLYYDNLAEQHLEGKWSDILTGAGNGTYSKEQIENLAEYYGFSPNQKEQLIKEAQEFKKNTYQANTNTALGEVTVDTTDEEIQDMVDQDIIDETGAEKLKEERKRIQIKDINDYIDSGKYDDALKLADKYYNNGNGTIDQNSYQKVYFDFWANGISSRGSATVADIKQDIADIDNQQKEGKLSYTDAQALKQYIYACAGEKLSPSSYTVQVDTKRGDTISTYNNILTIRMDGKEYSLTVGTRGGPLGKGSIDSLYAADKDTSKVLAGIAGSVRPNENTLVMYQGKLWLYNGIWVRLSNPDGLYSTYNTLVGYQAKPTKPTHSTGSTSSTGGGTGGVGGGRLAGGLNSNYMNVRV